MCPRRCVATVKAKTLCDLFVLEKSDFSRILQDYPRADEGRTGALQHHGVG